MARPRNSTGTAWEWDEARLKAVKLLIEGEMTHDRIADECGIHQATLTRWKNTPEFKERIDEYWESVDERTKHLAVSNKARRVERLNSRWAQINRLITERGEAMAGKVAGGSTGLMAREEKSIGSGPSTQIVDVYRFDAALVREEREIAKQAAQELGQWIEKAEVAHDFAKLTDDELLALAAKVVGGGTGDTARGGASGS